LSLRTIVPTLGFLVFTAGAASAADSGLNIGGFVDTIASASDAKDHGGDNPYYPSADTSGGVYYDMQAAVELRLGYKLNDKVGAKADVEWNNGTYNGHPTTYLEQAFVNYNFTDTVSLTGGKFTSYAGWISADADGLYRINAGPLVAMYQPELVGGALNVAPNKQLGISLFLVNGLGLYANPSAIAGNPDSTNDNPDKYLSAAFDVVFTLEDIGTLNAEFGYDYHGSDVAAWEFGLNATIKPKAAEGLTLGAEVLYEDFSDDTGAAAWSGDSSGVGLAAGAGDGNRLGAMLMVNHTIPIGVPASITVMGQYVSTDVDANADKVNTEEISVALLTNPTGDSKFGFNAEVAYQTTDPGDNIPGADSNDSWWLGVEMIAVIP